MSSTNNSETSISIIRELVIFKDFLTTLDSIRNHIKDMEQELKNATLEFFKSENYNESDFIKYYLKINNCFSYAVNTLKLKTTIDNDKKLKDLTNSCLNLSRSYGSKKINWFSTVEFLTDFLENLKYTEEILQIILDNYEKQVFDKLQKMSALDILDINSQDLSEEFQKNIRNFTKDINELISNFRLLIISTKIELNRSLLTKSALSERLVSDCNVEKLPLLLIVPDLITKLESIFRYSRMWLDIEEKMLFQIHNDIRDVKLRCREKYQSFVNNKENHVALMKKMQHSYIQCQKNRKRMIDVKRQIVQLKQQIDQSKDKYNRKLQEKNIRENFVEFLELSINRTRRNYILQLQRQKLRRELTSLQSNIIDLHTNLEHLSSQHNQITDSAASLANQNVEAEHEFLKIRERCQFYSHNVTELRSDLDTLKATLSKLQSWEMLKSSPEFVENINSNDSYPTITSSISGSSSVNISQKSEDVKLAPSLLHRINNRKQASITL